MTTGYDAPMSVAHIRARLPDARGRRISGRRCQIFITLPGMPEVALPGVVRLRPNLGADDVTGVRLDLLATCEIEFVDEP